MRSSLLGPGWWKVPKYVCHQGAATMDLMLTVVGVEPKEERISCGALFYNGRHVTPRGCCWSVKQDHQFLTKISTPSSYEEIVGQTGLFNLGIATGLGEGKLWIQTCLLKIDRTLHPPHAEGLIFICFIQFLVLITNWYLGKKFHKKRKRLKVLVLLENNQSI